MPLIRLETYIHAPAERWFDSALNVDAHRNSVAHTRERAVAGVTEGLMGLGDIVTWEAVHFGIKQHLTVKITEFERPFRFTDEMLQGAFQEMKHVHEFVPQADGTLMIDRFLFRAPLGVFGWLAETLVLTRYMRNFLLMRNSHLKHLVEANPESQFSN